MRFETIRLNTVYKQSQVLSGTTALYRHNDFRITIYYRREFPYIVHHYYWPTELPI